MDGWGVGELDVWWVHVWAVEVCDFPCLSALRELTCARVSCRSGDACGPVSLRTGVRVCVRACVRVCG